MPETAPDVTEGLARHILAGAFRAAEARYDAYQRIFDPILVSNADGIILFANASAEAFFGYWIGTMRGVLVDELVPDTLRDGHKELRARFFELPTARPMAANRQLVARRKDGTEVPVQISLSPDTVDGVPCVVAVVRDTRQWQGPGHVE